MNKNIKSNKVEELESQLNDLVEYNSRLEKENKELKDQVAELEFDDKLKCDLYEVAILENEALKNLARLIKTHRYSGGITDIELDEGTESYEIVEKALEVLGNE